MPRKNHLKSHESFIEEERAREERRRRKWRIKHLMPWQLTDDERAELLRIRPDAQKAIDKHNSYVERGRKGYAAREKRKEYMKDLLSGKRD